MAPIRSTVGVAQQLNAHVGIAAGRDWLGRLLVVHCASGAGGVTLSCSNGFTQAARPRWYGEE